jgi:hypothetical protein
LCPARAGYDKGQARGVEHHLNRHEGENQITPHEKARQPQGEQDSRQKKSVLHRNR